MSYNIAITSYFNYNEPNSSLRKDCFIPYFRELEQNNNQALKFFAVDWWSLKPDGTIKVFDILNHRVIDNFQIHLFHLVHIFRLGHFTIKTATLKTKWREFESRLNILAKARINCINPIDSLRYHLDKEYLLFLQDNGIPVIPTKKLSTSSSYKDIIKECADYFKIIKPINGECGKLIYHTNELTPKDIEYYRTQTSHILIQPFIPEIHQGEVSIIYIGKKFFCAALKKPKNGEFRANGPHIGTTITTYDPSSEEINLGLTLLEILPKKLEIFRLDYIITPKGPLIMEVEALDPYYYTQFDISCAQKLSDFYIEYLNKGLNYE